MWSVTLYNQKRNHDASLDSKPSGGQGPQQYLAFVAQVTSVPYFQSRFFISTVMDGQAGAFA
jgi:hypothetical protein